MISYLGSLVQFSPGAGRAGRCRELSLCVGSLRRVLAGQPEAWCALSTARRAPSLRGLSAVSGSLQTGTRACLPGGRGWLLWGFFPFPLPLPPTSSGDGAALLCSFSVPLFCEPPAVCSGRSIFLLLSHSLKKSPSDCSPGLRAGPQPKQMPPAPLRSAPTCWWRVPASGVLFCWEFLLGR